MNAVELININKTYKKTTVFNSFNFKLEENKTAVFLSNDKYKKDILASIIALVLRVDSGTIKYFGEEVSIKDEVYNVVSLMPKRDGLSEHLTVLENLRLMAKTRDFNEEEALNKIKEFGDKYEISSRFDDKAKTLSHSLKKIVSFLMCIITDAKILVLDDPFKDVDEKTKNCLMEYIKEIKGSKTIIIFTDLEETKDLADDLYDWQKEGL